MADTLEVKCVWPESCETQEDLTEAINIAFKELEKTELNPVWIKEKDCLQVKDREQNTIYVCDPFEGRAYEHLKSVKSRLFGPPCVLTCLRESRPLPKVRHPLYSLAMKNVVISCTCIGKQVKEELHHKVELMGGVAVGALTEEVTHLVAEDVGSKKYLIAGQLGKPIMLPDWINAVWETSQTKFCKATDEEFQKYVCPVFKNHVITASGFDNNERQDIKQAVDSEGGKYTGEMRINDCTHLIINEPKGQKYEFARKWKINIVKLSWLYDSIQKGYCLDENLYKVERSESGKNPKGTSTPQKTRGTGSTGGGLSDVSNITNLSIMSHINDTVFDQNKSNLDDTRRESMAVSKSDPVESLDLKNVKNELVFDGCKMFLSGFYSSKLDTLKKAINVGGGTRFNQLDEGVSHVVMEGTVESHLNQIKQWKTRPHIVSSLWLVESLKQGSLADEETYTCVELPAPEPGTPQPKKKLPPRQSSISNETKSTPKAPVNAEPPQQAQPEGEEMDDIMSQYLPQQDMTDESALMRAMDQLEEKDVTITGNNGVDTGETDGDATPDEIDVDDVGDSSDGLFAKKVFVIVGFEHDQEASFREFIEENNGQVLSSVRSRTIPDYAMVPIVGAPVEMTVNEIVTNLWMQMCVESGELLPLSSNELFQPVTLVPNVTPLQDCVISVSGYAGAERDCLMHLAELLGASPQESFARKATKKYQASTHLLVREPEGSKYNAAKKWNLPAVTKQWLFACARSGKKIKEEKYLIDNVGSGTETENEKHEPITNNKNDTRLSQGNQQNTNKVQSEDSRLTADSDTSVNKTKNDQSEKEPNHVSKKVNAKTAQKDQSAKSIDTGSLKQRTRSSKSISDMGHVGIKTPLSNSRVKELRNEASETPKPVSNGQCVDGAGIDTPGKFLDPNKMFQPQFDTTDLMEALKTPTATPSSRRNTKKHSLTIDELFDIHIPLALKNTAVPFEDRATTAEKKELENVEPEQVQPSGPLSGVIIAVSKKLSGKQSDYNNMAASLGADYRWTYDETCTHFIFQGKLNDNTKEFRIAREQGKTIVSPHWLVMCHEQNALVEESLFPHNYNPNFSLQSVVSKKATPARATRRSTRVPKSAKKEKPTNSQRATRSQKPASPPHEELANDGMDSKEESTDTTPSEDEKMEVVENEAEAADDKGSEHGSLEMKEALNKQLESIKAVTNVQKQTKRKSMRRINSSGQLDASGESAEGSGSRSRPASRAQDKSQSDDKDTSKTSKVQPTVSKPDTHPEASQSLQVTWDDPTGRLEHEKLARELTRACSPTQYSESRSPPLQNAQYSSSEQEDEDLNNSKNNSKNDSGIITFKAPMGFAARALSPSAESSRSSVRTPTPEPPPIAFPLASRQTVKKESPKPIQMLGGTIEEDGEDDDATQLDDVKTEMPIFMFSGMSTDERADYGALVEQLGGKVNESTAYDPACTHIVVGTPSRNEKYLSFVASGKWILHKSYFEACRAEERFVEEHEHEWGSPAMSRMLQTMNQTIIKLGYAANRWREKITNAKQNGECQGAFQGWKCVICTDRNRIGGFTRLLQAGGAEVVATRPPYNNLEEITHAFMELGKINFEVDLNQFIQAGVHCLKPEYIASYLMEDPPPFPNEYHIPEVKDAMGTSKKRKGSTLGTPSKRGRRN